MLLVHRFFAPDVTAYSQMLAMIATQLKLDRRDVSVFTTQPSYNGIYDGPALPRKRIEDGVAVYRANIPGGGSSLGRLLGGLLFGVRLVGHALLHRKRYDVIMVSTAPPVFMGLCGVLAARAANANLVYHCMDLYPEIAIASGHAPAGPITRIARALDNLTISNSSATIVLSKDMLHTIAKRGAPTDRVLIQNNFTIDSASSSTAIELPRELGPSRRFRLIFAGNIGRFQGLETLLEAIALDGDTETEVLFLGGGAAKEGLRQQSEDLGISGRVTFVEHQPLAVAMKAMTEADLAVVSLAPGLINSAYPSKTVMYLEMGCRILAVVEPESELASLVVDNDLGVVAGPGEVEEIAKAIATERGRTTNQADKDRAQAVANDEFASISVLPRWTEIIAGLEPVR